MNVQEEMRKEDGRWVLYTREHDGRKWGEWKPYWRRVEDLGPEEEIGYYFARFIGVEGPQEKNFLDTSTTEDTG